MIRSSTKNERRGGAGRSSQGPRGACAANPQFPSASVRFCPLINPAGCGSCRERDRALSDGRRTLFGACLPRLARSPTPGAIKAGQARPRRTSIPSSETPLAARHFFLPGASAFLPAAPRRSLRAPALPFHALLKAPAISLACGQVPAKASVRARLTAGRR